MESAFYIMELSQLGNSIHHNIKKIDEQPKQGFINKNKAIHHLEELIKKGDYPFDRWFSFTIMELYGKSHTG